MLAGIPPPHGILWPNLVAVGLTLLAVVAAGLRAGGWAALAAFGVGHLAWGVILSRRV